MYQRRSNLQNLMILLLDCREPDSGKLYSKWSAV